MAKVRGSNPRASNQAGTSRHDSRVNESKGDKLETSSSSSLPGSEWEETRCPICMEFPHNAVLLICSSHEKGCRPYMCDTSCRHSNCLDQFCKSSQVSVSSGTPIYVSVTRACDGEGSEGESDRLSQSNGSLRRLASGLVCPLCRGQVFGFVIIEAARKYLNLKIRSCSLESCEFNGNYADLRKHARHEHPSLKPSEADPKRLSDWVRLEQQTDLEDTLSAYHLPFAPESTEEDVLLSAFARLENSNFTSFDWFDLVNGTTQLQNTTNEPPVYDDFLYQFDDFLYGNASEAEDDVQSAVGTRTVQDAAEFAVSPFVDHLMDDDSSGNGVTMFSRDSDINPGIATSNVAAEEFVITTSNGTEEVEFAFSPMNGFSLHGDLLCPMDGDSYPGIASNDNAVVEHESAPSPIYFSLYGEALCPRDDAYNNPGIASSDNGGLFNERPTATRPRRRSSNRREETISPRLQARRSSNRREETIRPRRRARYMPYSSSRHSS